MRRRWFSGAEWNRANEHFTLMLTRVSGGVAVVEFLKRNREELLHRCVARVAQRSQRAASPEQVKNGVPLFLEQLTETLVAEKRGDRAKSRRISGTVDGDTDPPSEIESTASAHGKQLLDLGYTVDQVVHDYGDLCQAITGLAVERAERFSADEFRTLNRCLDNAMASAVAEFSAQKDVTVSRRFSAACNERLGCFAHELRNSLHAATLALAALESGKLPVAGVTGSVLKRSLSTLTSLVNHSLEETRAAAGPRFQREVFSVASLIADAGNAAALDALARGCPFTLRNVEAQLEIEGNRELLLGALVNLLQNAFKFTHPHTEVALNAYPGAASEVIIDVEDHCGGLPPGIAEAMFRPFSQRHADRSGLGLGVSICRRTVEAHGGTLSVQDVPGTGCVFTIHLPLHRWQAVTDEA